jgi:hypothetical protein
MSCSKSRPCGIAAEVTWQSWLLGKDLLAEVTWLWILGPQQSAADLKRRTTDFAYCERFFQIAALWRKKALRCKAPESA